MFLLRAMCYGSFIGSSNENSEGVGCKRKYQRWHIVQEMKQCNEIPVCNFNLLHLVTGSGHLRSSPENMLCSRITSLLHFHHQQELLVDVIQVQQWQTLRNPFRALDSLCITRWAQVFYRRCFNQSAHWRHRQSCKCPSTYRFVWCGRIMKGVTLWNRTWPIFIHHMCD